MPDKIADKQCAVCVLCTGHGGARGNEIIPLTGMEGRALAGRL